MSDPLTFGVEFEFALACSYGKFPTESPDDGKPPILFIQEDLSSALGRSAAIPQGAADAILNVLHNSGFRTNRTPTDGDEEAGFATGEYSKLSRWTVARDVSIYYPHKIHEWSDVEVISPIMCFVPESLEAIKYVCYLLTQNFRINVNSSCGLHVHIGNGSSGFEFPLVQNLVAFLYIFEHVLSNIHPPHRRGNQYAQNLRTGSSLARELVAKEKFRLDLWWDAPPDAVDPKAKLTDALRRIFEVNDTDSLYKLIGFNSPFETPGWRNIRPMAVEIGNLIPDERQKYKVTIEFRQHAATLDGDRVAAWIQVIGGLMKRLPHVDSAKFRVLLLVFANAQDEERPPPMPLELWDLLEFLGLDEPASFYKARFWESGEETQENVLPDLEFHGPVVGWDAASYTVPVPSKKENKKPETDEDMLNKPWAGIESYTPAREVTRNSPSGILWRPYGDGRQGGQSLP